MRQQQSATRKKPSRLCKLLLLLVGFKICLLCIVLLEPAFNFGFLFPSSDELAATWRDSASRTPAQDQTQSAAADVTPEGAGPENTASLAASGADSSVRAELSAPARLKAEANPEAPAPVARRAPGVAFAATPSSMPPRSAQPAPGNSLSLEALTRKQEELVRREQDLKTLQAELDDRFQQLRDLELRLQVMLKDADEIKDSRYRHLVDVLSNMKARQAADVLATLDEKIAVRVLAGMRGRQAGEILSFADPVKAARLTEALARMQMPMQ